MKSKAPLSLVEQLIMILVFSVAAAVCLNAFAFSDRYSSNVEKKDHAVREAENTAELLKAYQGDFAHAAERYGGSAEENFWQIFYDDAWEHTQEADAAFRLEAKRAEEDQDYLGRADVSVYSGSDTDALFQLSVCWQEEKP